MCAHESGCATSLAILQGWAWHKWKETGVCMAGAALEVVLETGFKGKRRVCKKGIHVYVRKVFDHMYVRVCEMINTLQLRQEANH